MSTSHEAKTDLQIARLAWDNMGGLRELLKSFDFRVACIVTLLCSPAWVGSGWWDDVISVIPSLLGFTLGGFAIFLGFGSDQFKEMIADEDEVKSEYLSVSSAFLFIVAVQVAALLYAIVSQALWVPTPQFLQFLKLLLPFLNPIAWMVGYFLYIFGVVLSLRAAIRIFRVSRWYNSFLVAISAERDQQK